MNQPIGERTIADIQKRAGALVREYLSDINEIYERDSKIKLALPVELSASKQGTKIVVKIKGVKEKIEDTSSGYINESNMGLFDEEQTGPIEPSEPAEIVDPMRPCPLTKDETRTEKYCLLSCDLRCETIMAEGSAEGETFTQFRSCASWADYDTIRFTDAMVHDSPDVPASDNYEWLARHEVVEAAV